MSKPMGMDAAFRSIKPTKTEDAVWEAVKLAIENGWTPRRFMQEAWESWEYEARESVKHVNNEFGRMTREAK